MENTKLGIPAPSALMVPVDLGRTGLSIRVKLALVIGVLVATAIAALATFVLIQTREALTSETIRRGVIIGRNLADYSKGAMLAKDPLQAAQFAKDALNDDAMVSAVLVDEQGMIQAIQTSHRKGALNVGDHYDPLQGAALSVEGLAGDIQVIQSQDVDSGLAVLAFSFPIIKADVFLGTAYISLSQSRVQMVVTTVTKDVILLAVVFLAVALFLSALIANVIVRPVQKLTQGALAVGAGKMNTRIESDSGDELGVLARSFNAMTEGLQRAQGEMLEKQALMQELNIAQEIQQGLLPKKIPKVAGYELAAFYAPAKEVGGDYYDFIPVAGGRLALVVADVSGKSVPGSLGMTMARSVLRSQALTNILPADTLRKTNEVIQPDIRRGMFVTMFYAVLDPVAHQLACANAGHNPIFVLRADGQVEEHGPEGVALGLVPAAQFYTEDSILQVQTGDLVAMYTDGVTEAMNANSEEYGEDRFKESLQKSAHLPVAQMVEQLVADVRTFIAGAPPHDDITLVLVRRLA